MDTNLTQRPKDAVDSTEASLIIGASRDAITRARRAGDLKAYLDDSRHPPKYWYSRADIEAFAKQRAAEGHDIEWHASPMDAAYMQALRDMGGVSESEAGKASTNIGDRAGYDKVTGSARTLAARGLIEMTKRGKRTYRVALTKAGIAWCTENLEPMAPPEPEPEPALPPERREVVEAVLHDASTVTTYQAPTMPEAPGVSEPGPVGVHSGEAGAEVSPGAIAQALLRQTVRMLSDGDTAQLMTERDALRTHTEFLQARLSAATEREVRLEAELREVRGVLHELEAQLMPLLTGQPQSNGSPAVDWLDPATRTQLLRLVGEAARWAQ